ncbi:hypothetical protein FRC03_011379 [Tulasnella sp. 419]|nr:hypothetical protein FRC03_011379 [Tulasnella sp. 419]
MTTFAAAQAINASYSTTYRPVALFVGGTSGIGQGAAERFAHYTKGNAHILICGRNKSAADEIISAFPKTTSSTFEFIQCDASLMKNVVQASSDIKSRLSNLNYLVMSQGTTAFSKREDTSEGLDSKLALHFYSRWKFVDELLPLLLKAKDEGQEARVMSVMAAGRGGSIDTDDLGLKKNYSLRGIAQTAPTYNDIFVQEYAQKYPGVSFTHINPGPVKTPIVTKSHWALRALAYPIVALLAETPETCGEYLTSVLFRSELSSGAHHLDKHGDPVPASKLYVTDDARQKLMAHFKEVTSA